MQPMDIYCHWPILLAACSSSVKVGPEAVAGLTPDGTVTMNQVQAAFIGSGGGGSGSYFSAAGPILLRLPA